MVNKILKSFLRTWLPRSVRRQRILGGPLRGQWIVTSWHDYPAAITGYTERPLLAWFVQNVLPGETWLDIGAQYGYTALALCRLVESAGRVFAFEPVISTAYHLSQTRVLNHLSQLTVLPFGLGAPESLQLKQLPAERGMADSTIQCRERIESILVARLDWLWPQICGGQERIDGIKIDVQGMETETLRGMVELLKTFKPKLVVEVHSGVNRRKLLELLEDAGYSRLAIPIEPVTGESEPQYANNRSYAFKAL